jgi:hypothetical protein
VIKNAQGDPQFLLRQDAGHCSVRAPDFWTGDIIFQPANPA